MTNEVEILYGDQDFDVVSGVAPTVVIGSAQRFNGEIKVPAASDALNDEIKYRRWFDKSGTYLVRYIYKIETTGGVTDIGLDSPSGNNLFDGIDQEGSTNPNQVATITKEIPRGYHDISFFNQAGGASGFQWLIQALQFDLIAEHHVLGESAPAKEADGMVKLADYVCEIAEGDITLDLADVKKSKYSKIIVKIGGSATASLELRAQFNGNSSSNYHMNGARSTTTLVNLDPAAAAHLALATTSIITGAFGFEGELSIAWSQGTAILGSWDMYGGIAGSEQGKWVLNASGLDPLTSIRLFTSTSTWAVGTHFEVYGIKKK